MKVYLDNNATTAMLEEAVKAMMPYLTEKYANASSMHDMGFEAREGLEGARAEIAEILGAEPSEIFFTGSGTESDNIALRGVAISKPKGSHLIVSAIEHPAVLKTAKALENEYDVTYIPVGSEGIVNPDDIEQSIKDSTVLISVMHANNETGAIQPVEQISQIARDRGILMHTDAVQTVGKIPLNVKELGIDMLSASAHKFHGPKGVGILYKKKGVRFGRILTGGHHEKGIRPGTENVAGIVGMAEALKLSAIDSHEHIRELRDMLKGLVLKMDNVIVNTPENSVYNTLNVSFKGVEGEALLLTLSQYGVMASSGSACSSGDLEPSHVLLAMGRDHMTAHGSLRFSLSRFNTEEEIIYTADILEKAVARIENISPYKKPE